MDVLSLLRLVVRHWRVTAPGALLTILVVGVALQLSSPTYEATGSVVLLGPPEAPDVSDLPESAQAPGVGQNPFARYGDLSVVADILARVMDSDSKRGELESQGVTGYNVVANAFQRGPVVEVTGQGPDSDAAIRSTEVVLTEADAVLSELQRAEGADPEYFINSAPLDPPSTATAMYGSTVRAAIGALAVGALCTLGLAVLAEAFARRRTVRSTTAAGPDMSNTARPGTDGGASNGTRKADWSAILPALRSAREKQSQQEAGRQKTAQQEPSQQEPSQQQPSQQQPSQQEPAWQKTFQQEPSHQEPSHQEPSQQEPSRRESSWRKTAQEPASEFPADNGHRRPTTDRSP